MDENLARLGRIYPNSNFVLIPAYRPELWKDIEYNSKQDNKAAINRWKTNPLSIEEAQQKVDEGYRIGWVVPEGMCVVDIDNEDDERSQEYIERLLEKFEVKYNYNYTSRGIHMIFRDPTNKLPSNAVMQCGLNITVDIRANATGYIILPCNDPHRQWGHWGDFVEDIPYFLKPIAKLTTPSFIGMKDGDGRNDALFKWRTKLEMSHKLSEEEIEKCIRIINENLFDTPMSNPELFKTVLREKKKEDKPDATERENVYNRLANEIMGRFDIISYGDTFYMFNGVYYKMIQTIDLERLIHFEVSSNINDTGRSEIIKFLRIKTQVKMEDLNKEWYKIACNNGVLNLVNGELTQPTKADYNTICLSCTYNTDPVYSPRIDNFMKEIADGDVNKVAFLYQIAGYCLLKKNMFEKFFIFKGEGGTGKSTYMNLIQRMVGEENCAHIGLNQFDKDYHLASLLSKLVNIDDDLVDGRALEDTGKFKSLISGNTISVRQIYQPVMDFMPYTTCIFSCNRLPKIMDRTTGLFRRMVLLELNHKVEHPDPLFMTKVTDTDMEYFFFKAVEAIKQAIEEGHFRIQHSEQELLNMFKRRQSSINEWVFETRLTLGQLNGASCKALYSSFTNWASDCGYYNKLTMFSFKEEICLLYDVTIEYKADGEKMPKSIFVKKGDFKEDWMPL